MFATRARLLIATLWIGSLWTIGYLVAPTLFATLDDRVLAGTIAGRLFRVEAWLSVFCALALITLLKFAAGDRDRKADRQILWLAAGMLACTLIGYFGLQPFMAALREAAGPGGVMDAASRGRFGLLHGISSGIYLVQSLLGVALILKLR
jgi:hypothetical protein